MVTPHSAYATASACFHRDAQGRQLILNGGREIPPIYMFAGTQEPDNPEVVQFDGDVYQEIISEGVDERGYQWAELTVVRFNMIAKHPTFGRLVISYDGTRSGNRGTIRTQEAGNKFPIIHRTLLNVTASAENFPGMLLQNKGAPLEFISDVMDQWPPAETVYRLGVHVPFEMRENTGNIVATVNAGGVLVQSLSAG